MDSRTAGLVGGIAGGVLGLLGGAIGTYAGIANARAGAERRLTIRLALLMWGLMTAFLFVPIVLMLLKWIPGWVAQVSGFTCMTILLTTLPRMNRRLAAIREP